MAICAAPPGTCGAAAATQGCVDWARCWAHNLQKVERQDTRRFFEDCDAPGGNTKGRQVIESFRFRPIDIFCCAMSLPFSVWGGGLRVRTLITLNPKP
jgi:hypothetical protein